MELCFYNSVLTGMSCNGKQFTYVNQLASSSTDLSKRAEWFTCACCPPNVTRLLGYIGGYLWSTTPAEEDRPMQIAVHLYSSATLKVENAGEVVKLQQNSDWPTSGQVDFKLTSPTTLVTIKLRIPQWAGAWEVCG
jgi:DUF1680 family protein